jgi:streptogramin lyase
MYGYGVAKFSNSGIAISNPSGPSFHFGSTSVVPTAIAFDNSGNAWVLMGGNSVFELSSSGTLISGYFGGGLGGNGTQIAIDGSGDVWVANATTVSELSNSDTALSPSTGFALPGVLSDPARGVAVDGSGNVWVTEGHQGRIGELVGAATPVVTPLSVGVKNNTLGTRP